MENATKALILAGSVLVAILLISLGVAIFNTAQESAQNFNMSEYEIQQFNNKFTAYIGSSVSGTKINAMLDMVYNHNLLNEDEVMRVRVTRYNSDGSQKDHLIYKEWFFDTTNHPIDYPRVPVGQRYDVAVEINQATGLVSIIKVTEK